MAALVPGFVGKGPQQGATDALPPVVRINGQQEQFTVSRNDPLQGERDWRAVRRFGESQRNAGHRQDAGALRPSPGFAEAVVEGGLHDSYDWIEIAVTAPLEPELV